MDLNLHPRKETARYREIRDLLQGNTIVVCMGNRLTLAGFGMSMPIWSRVIAAVTTADEALEVVREHRPDLFFATEDLEQGYGIDLVREVERIHPPTRTLIFLRRESALVVNEAMEAGADGVMFVSSIGTGQGDFFRALKRTSEGSVYYPDVVREMARETTEEDREALALIEGLSERELEVLRALTSGQTNKEIAEALFISGETVKSHVSAIIGKLGVRDRTQAAIHAIRHGGDLITFQSLSSAKS